MSRKVHEFKGEEITVTFDRARCLHAEECVRGLPPVFDLSRRRWIDPSRADGESIVAVVERCPTGALHHRRHDGGPAEQPDLVNRVSVVPDGPLHVRGEVRIVREDGSEVLTDTRMALCRCGKSSRKPLCDGSHETTGFRHDGTVDRSGGDDGAGSDPGPLRIRLMAGGPLRVEGPLEICGAEGVVVRKDQVALCRCGASGRKPFCDGSHGRSGFPAEY